jgi:GT2 family glycosyltransferase
MTDLSIVIVSWNTREILLNCLQSVADHPPRCSYDIWVVDNASSDGSADAVRARFPEVHVIANEQNVGFAAANNQAIVASDGAAILLLNSDTLVHAGALDRLATFMMAHRRVGIAGAHLLNADGTLQVSWASFPTLWSELRGQPARAERLPDTRWVPRRRGRLGRRRGAADPPRGG